MPPPSFRDWLFSQNQQAFTGPRTEAEAALVRLDQMSRFARPEDRANAPWQNGQADKRWYERPSLDWLVDSVVNAPEWLTSRARKLGDVMQDEPSPNPRATRNFMLTGQEQQVSPYAKQYMAAVPEALAQQASLLNVALTAYAPLRTMLPAFFAKPVATTGAALGGMSIARVQEAAGDVAEGGARYDQKKRVAQLTGQPEPADPETEMGLAAIEALFGGLGVTGGVHEAYRRPPPGPPTFRGQPTSLPPGRHSVIAPSNTGIGRSSQYTPFNYQELGNEVPYGARPVGQPWRRAQTGLGGPPTAPQPPDIEVQGTRGKLLPPPLEPPRPMGGSPLGEPSPGAPFQPEGPWLGGLQDDSQFPLPRRARVVSPAEARQARPLAEVLDELAPVLGREAVSRGQQLPPSVRGLLAAQGGEPGFGGAPIPLPGEPLGANLQPFQGPELGPRVGLPAVGAERPLGPRRPPPALPTIARPAGVSAPDEMLEPTAIERFMRGDVEGGLELRDEAAKRQWFDENWLQLPPEAPPAAAPAELPEPISFAKPVVINIRGVKEHVIGVEYLDSNNVALVQANGKKQRVPIALAEQILNQPLERPTPAAAAPDRFDIYPPEEREAMRARVAEAEGRIRPAQGQQGIGFEGPVVGEVPGRALSPLEELEQRLAGRMATIPRELEPSIGQPSQGPLPMPAEPVPPPPKFLPPFGPLTAPPLEPPGKPLGTVAPRAAGAPGGPSIFRKPADLAGALDMPPPPAPPARPESLEALITATANPVADRRFAAVLDAARKEGFAGDEGQLRELWEQLEAENLDWRQSAADVLETTADDPERLLRLIAKHGGLGGPGAKGGELDILWEHSPDQKPRKVGEKPRFDKKTGLRIKGKPWTRAPKGRIGGIGGVLSNLRDAKSWDAMREAISQEPGFEHFKDIGGEQEFMAAVFEAASGKRSIGRQPKIGDPNQFEAGWWRKYMDQSGEPVAAGADEFPFGSEPEAPTGLGQLLGVEEPGTALAPAKPEVGPIEQVFYKDYELRPRPDGKIGVYRGDDMLVVAEDLDAARMMIDVGILEVGPVGGGEPAGFNVPTDAISKPPAVIAPESGDITVRPEAPETPVEPPAAPPPPPGGGDDRTALRRGMRAAAGRDLAAGDIGAFTQAEIKEFTDRLGIGFGEFRRQVVAGELDTANPDVIAALDSIADARTAAKPNMKQARDGLFLAPPDKDYAFVKLPSREWANAHPEVKAALTKAGYRYKHGQEAWIKDRHDWTPEQLEAEAAEILGGVVAKPSAKPVAPPPEDVIDVNVNEAGEGVPQPAAPNDVWEALGEQASRPDSGLRDKFRALVKEMHPDDLVPGTSGQLAVRGTGLSWSQIEGEVIKVAQGKPSRYEDVIRELARREAAAKPPVVAPPPADEPKLTATGTAGATKNKFGETETKLFTDEEIAPLSKTDVYNVKDYEDLWGKAFETALVNKDPRIRKQAMDSLEGIQRVLLDHIEDVSDATLERLSRGGTFNERTQAGRDDLARVINEEFRRQGKTPPPPPSQGGMFEEPPAKPQDLGDLLGQAAKPVEPGPTATVPPAAEAPTTMEQLPANVRSFLQRQLGYSADDINAMSPDEAIALGQGRTKKPAPPVETPAEPGAVQPPPVAAGRPTGGGGGRRLPQTVEELLAGYLEGPAQLKVEQAQRRMGAARAKAGAAKVPVAQTYRGGFPKESEMEVPRRVAPPYRGKTLAELDKAIAEGRQVDAAQYEAALEADAKTRLEANAARAKARPEDTLAEQERDARGLPPVERGALEGATKHKDALHKGGLTRANAKRAYAMKKMLETGTPDSIDEYARALTEQITRENEQAMKWGVSELNEGQKKWGDDFTRLKYDKETGQYLGSAWGAIYKFFEENPWMAWRYLGGAVTAAVGAQEDPEHWERWLAAGTGIAIGPGNLKKIAPVIRKNLPSVTANLKRLKQEWKDGPTKYQFHVRRARDYAKDLKRSQMWRSIGAVDPLLLRDVMEMNKQAEKAVHGATPGMRQQLAAMYHQEAVDYIRAAAKFELEKGHEFAHKYLTEFAQKVQGVPTEAAKLAEKMARMAGSKKITAQHFEQAFRQINRQVYRVQLGVNPGSALVNRTQSILALPRLGVKAWVEGIRDARGKAGKQRARDAGLIYDDVLADARRKTPAGPVGEVVDALDKAAFGMFSWADEAARSDVYHGALKYARYRGASPQVAEKFAFELVTQTQGLPGELAGNPFLHQFMPLRALSHYPTLYAELLVDLATHPDKRVALRAVALLSGTAALTAMTGVSFINMLVPRFSVWGPVADIVGSLGEESKHIPGGEAPSHSVLDDVKAVVTPKGPKKFYDTVKARIPESWGGYGEGLQPRQVYDRKGLPTLNVKVDKNKPDDRGLMSKASSSLGFWAPTNKDERRTATEDLLNLLGGETTRQTGIRARKTKEWLFRQQKSAEATQLRDEGRRNLRDAIERNDTEDILKYEKQLSPGQLKEFYRQSLQSPTERTRRTMTREQKRAFDEYFGGYKRREPAPGSPR